MTHTLAVRYSFAVRYSLYIPHWGIYIPSMTIDKWIVLVVAICIIIGLNVNFIRRMNRRGRDDKKE